MKKAIKRPVLTQEVLAQLRLPLADLMRTTLLDTVITAGSIRAIERSWKSNGRRCADHGMPRAGSGRLTATATRLDRW
jgi:hypothetical protein